MLRTKILAAITEEPNISAKTLMGIFPRFQHEEVRRLLWDLRGSGLIEMSGQRYRLPEQRGPSAPQPYAGSGFIAPLSRARLMPGR